MKCSFINLGLSLIFLGILDFGWLSNLVAAMSQPAPHHSSLVQLKDLPHGFEDLKPDWLHELKFDLNPMEIENFFAFQRLQLLAVSFEIVFGGRAIKPDMRDEITTEGSTLSEVVADWPGVDFGETQEHSEVLEGVGDRAVRTIMTMSPFGFPVQANMILFEYNEKVCFLITFYPIHTITKINDVALAKLMVERL